eukprot:CAMPEP_0119339918 /NCGR_PEP_ID=MMETSP1333-20130426/99331_1 /TAXON_ID=418940 /ORGANISM="Scyphosphaera apsteinii, Strain RCC1455" /LENGTH=49 /DNA_ID= /DNA_START= /DNA_END= /DNA_ORIENTATION=
MPSRREKFMGSESEATLHELPRVEESWSDTLIHVAKAMRVQRERYRWLL